MSEKKRQKKDGQRKDKQNQAMREAQNDKAEKATLSQQEQDVSDSMNTEPGAAETRENRNS